jgi:hypothetical protein
MLSSLKRTVITYKKLTYSAIILVLIFLGFCIYWVHYLQVAHSSFENYYAFRGCIELIQKTDTYGTCKLADGSIIKLVQVDNKWFLDGDLGWP